MCLSACLVLLCILLRCWCAVLVPCVSVCCAVLVPALLRFLLLRRGALCFMLPCCAVLACFRSRAFLLAVLLIWVPCGAPCFVLLGAGLCVLSGAALALGLGYWSVGRPGALCLAALVLLFHAVVDFVCGLLLLSVLCLAVLWCTGLFRPVLCSALVSLPVSCVCVLRCSFALVSCVLRRLCVVWLGLSLFTLSLLVARVGALFLSSVPRCLALMSAMCSLLVLVLCFAAPPVRCSALLCWRACIVSLCCALFPLFRRLVSCGAACCLWLLVARSRWPLLFPGGRLRRWCTCLAPWPPDLVLAVVRRGAPALLRSLLWFCVSVWCRAVVPWCLFCGAARVYLVCPRLTTSAKPVITIFRFAI